jgi:hypothetical protein
MDSKSLIEGSLVKYTQTLCRYESSLICKFVVDTTGHYEFAEHVRQTLPRPGQ